MTQQPARYPFRAGAYAVAIFCFICAGLSWLFAQDIRLMLTVVCLFVGFVMLVIGQTGYWPPKK